MPRKKGGKGKHLYGIYPQTHPKPIRQYVDYDYIDRLSPEEQAWLAEFTDRHYGADFRGDKKWSTKARRVRYNAKNSANRDLYSIKDVSGLLVRPDSVPVPRGTEREDGNGWLENIAAKEQDLVTPTQRYLNSPEYKAALAEFREAVPAHRGKKANHKKLARARYKLEKVTYEPED